MDGIYFQFSAEDYSKPAPLDGFDVFARKRARVVGHKYPIRLVWEEHRERKRCEGDVRSANAVPAQVQAPIREDILDHPRRETNIGFRQLCVKSQINHEQWVVAYCFVDRGVRWSSGSKYLLQSRNFLATTSKCALAMMPCDNV